MDILNTLILIRGAGDIASGTALRLIRAGFPVAMTDLPAPSTIRRTVSFSPAITAGKATVEGVCAARADDAAQAKALLCSGIIPVLPDPELSAARELVPAALVDAVLAKRNIGTRITDAPIVIGLGPGFTAGVDCHAAIETMRGHTLGRALYSGSPLPNTGVPGPIGGYAAERVMHAPAGGVYSELRQIGDTVEKGEAVAEVSGIPVTAKIAGVLRGNLPTGFIAAPGLKCADIDPRAERESCFTVSDKALAIGGGVLEALLHFLYATKHGNAVFEIKQ